MKIINFFIFLTLILSTNIATAKTCSEVFSLKQLWVLQEAFDHGEDHGLGHTMAAIAWQESNAGLYLIRRDPNDSFMNSYGPFQILLKTAKKRRGCGASCSNLRQRLLNDFQYSADLAIEELKYWKGRLGSYWKAFAGYNAGNAWNSKSGLSYSRAINNKILYLKTCVRF